LAVPAAPAVTVWVPLVASVPLQAPDAVQLLPAGLATLQVIVTTWPEVVAVGEALMLTTGVAAAIDSVVLVVAAVEEELPPPPHAASARHSKAPAR
jgi:hypothetical protein